MSRPHSRASGPAPVPPSARDAARAELGAALAARSPHELTVVTLSVQPVSPRALWDEASDALLFAAPDEPAQAGLGTALLLEGDLRAVRDAAREAFARLTHRGAADLGPAPRLTGGFAFDRGATREAIWAGFGPGTFVLPRWSAGEGWLRFAVDGPAEPAVALRELDVVLERLARGSSLPPAPALLGRVDEPRGRWNRRVEDIVRAIEAGAATKIVAARRSELRFDGDFDVRRVLDRLLAGFPGCTAFALRRAGTVFFGATPERLVRRSGQRVFTEALAGTASPDEADALSSSAKDLAEHAPVAEAIAQALAPLTERLHMPDVPVVRSLPNVVHLQTPIEGTLHEDVDVLDLVEALHPTPAVGGVPREVAARWIAENETPRGWYAAPFGWLDATGDGSFVVALRSGLLRGDTAWAFAGGGIVAGSEPGREHRETVLKLRPILGALGVDDAPRPSPRARAAPRHSTKGS